MGQKKYKDQQPKKSPNLVQIVKKEKKNRKDRRNLEKFMQYIFLKNIPRNITIKLLKIKVKGKS